MSTRLKDMNWAPGDEKGNAPTWERVSIAVLMDIRDRLDVLRCHSFIDIPSRLLAIERQVKLLRRAKCHKKHLPAGKSR